MSIRVGFAWMMAGNIAVAVSQWGMLVLIAKAVGVVAVGKFALALAIASPLYAFASFKLRAVQATDPESGTDFNHYLGFTLLSVLAATFVIILIAFFFIEAETRLIVLFVAFAKACETISDIVHGFFQKHELFTNIGISQIVKALTGLSIVAGFLYFTQSLSTAILGYAVSRIAALWLYDLREASAQNMAQTHAGIRPKFEVRTLKYLFITGFPIGLVVALNVLQTSLPRFALAEFMDEATVGYFAAMSYFVVSGAIFINAWAQATLPRLSRAYVNSAMEYTRILVINCLFALVIGGVGVAVAALFGGEILALLYTPDFANMGEPFVMIMAAGALTYLSAVIGNGVTATRSFRSQAVVAIIVSVVMAVALFKLVPAQGLIGAAIATAVAAGTRCGIQLVQIARVLHARS